MRKYVVLLIVVCLCLIGCGKEEPKKSFTATSLLDEIEKVADMKDSLAPLKDTMLYHIYLLDRNEVEEIMAKVSTGATAEEIAIVKTRNPKAAKKAFEKRVALRKSEFQDYLPKEIVKLNEAVIEIKGNYVILCISDNASKVEALLNEYE